MSGPDGSLDRLVEAAIAEDVGDGDPTTEWTVPPGAEAEARIVSRERGVMAGWEPARRAFGEVDVRVEVLPAAADGEAVEPGEVVGGVRGPLRAILTAERTALNFLGRLSGIATLTARFVAAVEGTGCRVTDTRKTTPGWRRLEKAATRAGGATNHRRGLYDMVLIKENHVRAAGGVAAALEAVLGRARDAGLPVEVEVTTLAELEEALRARPDRVLLDNMSVAELQEAVGRTRELPGGGPRLEASGGIGLETVREVARTGVDYVSVGRITHSAPALDLSLLVEEVEER